MSRPRVYHTPDEARRIRNGYAREYQRKQRAKGEDENKAPHGGAHAQRHLPPPDDVAADAVMRLPIHH